VARHPLTVAGIRKLVDTMSDATVSACKRLDNQDGVAASVSSHLEMDGEFSVTREGEITFGGKVKTNLPTEPVAGEAGGEWSRGVQGSGDGSLRITFSVTAEVR